MYEWKETFYTDDLLDESDMIKPAAETLRGIVGFRQTNHSF